MEFNYLVVLITAPSMEVGRAISGVLIERKLAACVNLISPIRSVYLWQGQANDEAEVLLVVKTRADVFEPLTAAVKELHPYDVPEIIGLPVVMGEQQYLGWIDDEVSKA